MKRKCYTSEQAVRKLREGERRLNAGEELGSVLGQLEITESTWNRWRSTYGGMKAGGGSCWWTCRRLAGRCGWCGTSAAGDAPARIAGLARSPSRVHRSRPSVRC